MDVDAEKYDLSNGYGFMNSHTVYQLNGLKVLMNYNDRGNIQMNSSLHN